MKLATKVSGWVMADWGSPNPNYKFQVNADMGNSAVLDFGSFTPYTVEGYRLALAKWSETKAMSWGIALIIILQTSPVLARLDKESSLPYKFTFEDAVYLLPEELVAEFLLEGILV